MRKQKISIPVLITVVFVAFMLGFLTGKNQNRGILSVSVPQGMLSAPTSVAESEEERREITDTVVFPININRCGSKELMALPGVGEVLTERILIYREKNGGFSQVEELLCVEGIGKKKLEEIIDLVTVGGLR